MKATESQIKNWKKEHGDVFEVEVVMDPTDLENLAFAYVRKPSLDIIQAASKLSDNGDDMKANEILYNYCLISADDRIINSDEARLSVMVKIGGLFQIKEATIKKL